jgi:D-alanine-D-alanine ligase
MSDNCPNWFVNFARIGKSLKDEVGVVLVANVKGRTQPIDDYEGDSIITEFLSAAELDTLVSYFENAGIFCEPVIDEQGFLRWLAERRKIFPRHHALVFNLAQNGTGPARLSLIAAMCRLNGLPLFDCGDAYSVAITQHKFHCLSLLSHFGLPIARSWWFGEHGWFPTSPPEGLRLIAKLTYEAASIGMAEQSVFEMRSSYEDQLSGLVNVYRQRITVQEFIPGFEVEVPVFGTENGAGTLAAVGIELQGRRNLADRILTYQAVFGDGYGFYNFADENPQAGERILAIARQAFVSLGLAGIARIDFRVRDDGSPFIMEVNSKPHITQHSGFMYALKTIDKSGLDLVHFLVGCAAWKYGLLGSAVRG